jgi:hypothetical protein
LGYPQLHLQGKWLYGVLGQRDGARASSPTRGEWLRLFAESW